MQIKFTTSELDRLYDALLTIQSCETSGSRDYDQEDEDDSIKRKLKSLFKQAEAEENEDKEFRAEVLEEAEKIVKARRKKK